MAQYVFHEPGEYGFKNRDGVDGKFFGTSSQLTEHLIIECHDKLTVFLRQQQVEFDYYVLVGQGEFIFEDGEPQAVKTGDLIVVPPNVKYTYRGELKMLLINTPHFSQDQEESFPLGE